jgi:hypothetical protein
MQAQRRARSGRGLTVLTGLVVAVALLFSANPAGATTSHHKLAKSLAAEAPSDSDRTSMHKSHRHRPHKQVKSAGQAHKNAAHKNAAQKEAAHQKAAHQKAPHQKAAHQKAAAHKPTAPKAASKDNALHAQKRTDSETASRASRASHGSRSASAAPLVTDLVTALSDGRSAVGQAVNASSGPIRTSSVATVNPVTEAMTAGSESTKSVRSIAKDASGSVVGLLTTALKAASKKPASKKPASKKPTSQKPTSNKPTANKPTSQKAESQVTPALQTPTSQTPSSQATVRESATPQSSSSPANSSKASAQPSPIAARTVPAKANVAEPLQRIGLTVMASAGVLGWLVALLVLAIGGILIFTGTSRRGASS